MSAEQTIGLRDTALAVHPLGLYRVQPRALGRQIAAYDPHAPLAALLHFPVVLTYPLPDLLANVPAGVVPHQHQHLLAHRRQFLRAPRKELGSYPAYGASVHEAQPRLLKLRHEQPVAGDGLRLGVIFGERLLDQARWPPIPAPGVQRGESQATPPGLVLEAHHPLGIDLREANQPVAAPFFLSYSGSGEVIQRLARSQRTPMRSRVARSFSASPLSAPSTILAHAAISSVLFSLTMYVFVVIASLETSCCRPGSDP